MRVKLSILLFLVIANFNSVAYFDNDNCDENSEFKNDFFKNIKSVEDYVKHNGVREQYNIGVSFLSKYVKISTEKMLNYNNSYESLDAFETDKKEWIEWYELHKCSYLQFK